MILEGAILLGTLGYQVNKSTQIDEQTMKKNIKAFTKTADAQRRLEQSNENTYNALTVNAKRKHALLTCHLRMFQDQFAVIKKIQFEKGQGIEEIEHIEEIKEQVQQYISLPAVVSGKAMSDSQLLISFAFRGIGGLMIDDSKRNLKVASANMAQANAVSAQIDTMCAALDGIARHTEIVTDLLEKLGMIYMLSLKNLTKILNQKGTNARYYTQNDINVINASLKITKVLYAIINTPLIDANGKIEQESKIAIENGQKLLNQINGGI